MKKLLLALAIIMAITSLASAEVLVTANPIGAGKWAVLGNLQYSLNSQAVPGVLTNSNMYGIGGFVGYGILDKLDLYGKIGYGIAANPASGVTVNGIVDGLAAKYTVLEEGKSMPVSVAAGLGYQITTTNMTVPIPGGTFTGQAVLGDIGLGAIASKVMVPYVPYGAIIYHSLNQNPGGVTGSRIEVAVGGEMLLSATKAVLAEFSYNSYSGNVGTYTDNQISIAYGQTL